MSKSTPATDETSTPANKPVARSPAPRVSTDSNTIQPPSENPDNESNRPGTPPRPPYSPVTPVLNHITPLQTSAANGSHPVIPPPTSPSPTSQAPPYNSHPSSLPPPVPPTFAPEPPPVPISESENPDAIALRSAISILQLQKQQSLRDIQSLEKLKEAAAADPEKFARELADGKLSRKEHGGIIDLNHEADAEEEDGHEQEMTDSDAQKSRTPETIPPPQNVVRMPPVNWAKYQVVGDTLDKMHEEQLRRPSISEPRRDDVPAPEYMLASPYQPLTDRLESPTKAKGTNKSKKT